MYVTVASCSVVCCGGVNTVAWPSVTFDLSIVTNEAKFYYRRNVADMFRRTYIHRLPAIHLQFTVYILHYHLPLLVNKDSQYIVDRCLGCRVCGQEDIGTMVRVQLLNYGNTFMTSAAVTCISSMIPVIGSLIAAQISFRGTYSYALNLVLDNQTFTDSVYTLFIRIIHTWHIWFNSYINKSVSENTVGRRATHSDRSAAESHSRLAEMPMSFVSCCSHVNGVCPEDVARWCQAENFDAAFGLPRGEPCELEWNSYTV